MRFQNKDGQWQVSPADTPAAETVEPTEPVADWSLNIEDRVSNSAKYTTHVPVYDLTAAAGSWSPEGVSTEVGWLAVPNQKLSKGMFVARVTGQSMQPKIPSGSWCLFRPCPAGSRQGRLILVSDYRPIQISPEHADDLRIIGEFVCVIENWSNKGAIYLHPERI